MSVLTTVVGAFVLALLVATLIWGGAGALRPACGTGRPWRGLALNLNKRRKSAATVHEQRERARTHKVEFTERDEQTLVSE